MAFLVRPKRDNDAAALAKIWTERYGATSIVSRGRKHDALMLPGLVAAEDLEIQGALTFRRDGGEIEVVTLDSLVMGQGVGTALLEAMATHARNEGAKRLWLVTSNDNLRAVRFYQRRGWDMVTLHRDAITEARKSKPEIPELGDYNIPIRHEIEFELVLQ